MRARVRWTRHYRMALAGMSPPMKRERLVPLCVAGAILMVLFAIGHAVAGNVVRSVVNVVIAAAFVERTRHFRAERGHGLR